MEVRILAQRLCFEERARIEALNGAGFNASEIAVSLGRHPTTVQRELARGGGACGYEAEAAQRVRWWATDALISQGKRLGELRSEVTHSDVRIRHLAEFLRPM